MRIRKSRSGIINEEYGFIDKSRKNADFLSCFEDKAKGKYQKWDIVCKHFREFCNGRCFVKDVTAGLCNDFRNCILNLKVKNKGYSPISTNSAAGYWSTFRALLKMAYKDGWLKDNLTTSLNQSRVKTLKSVSLKLRKSGDSLPLHVRLTC